MKEKPEDIPPHNTRRTENCRYRIDGSCYNAINYLRPWQCSEHCIAKLDYWVRKQYPDMSEDEVKKKVRRIALKSKQEIAD